MRKERLLFGVALTAACAIVVLAICRIQTYLCAQDSATYIRLAKAILHEAPGSPAWVKAMTFVAPVYPLGLALAMKLGGEFAPYWVNPVLALLLLGIHAGLLRAVFGSPRAAAVALLASLYILLTGFPLNPHFLLYAFRELPSLLLLVVGMRLLLVGRDSGRSWPFTAAALSFLLAAGVREPSVCGLVGPAMWLVTARGLAGERRRRAAIAFFAPFLLALVAAAAAAAAADIAVNKQMLSWTRRLGGQPLAQTLQAVRLALVGQAGFLRDEMGWAGLALAALGVWRLRRNREAVLFFLVTAVSFYLFYGSYIAHRRYFLAVLFFVCPFAGYGLHAVLDWLGMRARRLSARAAGGVAHAAACVALAVALAVRASALQPWGARVRADEIRAFRDSVGRIPAGSAMFFVERRCDDLGAALGGHTDVRLGNALELAGLASGAGRPACVFFRPLGEACLTPGLVRDWGARVEEILRARGDLVPVKDAEGGAMEIALARGRYAVLELAPWSSRSVEETVDVSPGEDAVLWLDFRASGSCGKRVTLRGPDGKAWHRWKGIAGDGIQGFFVPGRAVRGGEAVVSVESGCPIPGSVVLDAVPWHRSVRFDLMGGRRLSALRWLEPSSFVTGVNGRFGVLTRDGGRFRVPVPKGGSSRDLRLTFLWGPRERRDQRVTCAYEVGGARVSAQAVDLSRYESKHVVALRRPAGDELMVDLRVEPPADGHLNLALHEIRMELAEEPGRAQGP